MRIRADLLPPRPRLLWPLLTLFITLCILLVGLAYGVYMEASTQRAEMPPLERQLAKLHETRRSIRPPREVLPPRAELERVRTRVRELNTLAKTRGWNTLSLLDWLERQLPDQVYLRSLQHRPGEGEALLTAESQSAEALTTLLRVLEHEQHFTEVLLNRQGVMRDTGSVQFEIRIRERR